MICSLFSTTCTDGQAQYSWIRYLWHDPIISHCLRFIWYPCVICILSTGQTYVPYVWAKFWKNLKNMNFSISKILIVWNHWNRIFIFTTSLKWAICMKRPDLIWQSYCLLFSTAASREGYFFYFRVRLRTMTICYAPQSNSKVKESPNNFIFQYFGPPYNLGRSAFCGPAVFFA